MSNFDKDLVTTNLQKAKDEERMRSARVQSIIKDAITEAVSEVKEGSSKIRSIAKDMLLAIVEKPDDNREEIAEVGIDQENSPHIAVKQRLENFKLWYRDTLVQAESTSPGLFQQKQADFEGKVVANAGISAAQKEHQIKQQLKQFFQTIVTNLES